MSEIRSVLPTQTARARQADQRRSELIEAALLAVCRARISGDDHRRHRDCHRHGPRPRLPLLRQQGRAAGSGPGPVHVPAAAPGLAGGLAGSSSIRGPVRDRHPALRDASNRPGGVAARRHGVADEPDCRRALAHVTEEGLRLLTDYLRARIVAGELRITTQRPARALFSAIITKHLSPADADSFETDLVASCSTDPCPIGAEIAVLAIQVHHVGSMFLATALAIRPAVLLFLIARTAASIRSPSIRAHQRSSSGPERRSTASGSCSGS